MELVCEGTSEGGLMMDPGFLMRMDAGFRIDQES